MLRRGWRLPLSRRPVLLLAARRLLREHRQRVGGGVGGDSAGDVLLFDDASGSGDSFQLELLARVGHAVGRAACSNGARRCDVDAGIARVVPAVDLDLDRLADCLSCGGGAGHAALSEVGRDRLAPCRERRQEQQQNKTASHGWGGIFLLIVERLAELVGLP